MKRRTFLTAWPLVAAAGRKAQAAPAGRSLFDGRSLAGWTKTVVGHAPNEDPDGVFSVVDRKGESVIKVSGTQIAGLMTQESFEDFHFSAEFCWGEGRYGPRAKEPRDSGLLYHGFADPDPKTGWVESLEFGILEGGETGDFWSVPGRDGGRIHVSVQSEEIPEAKRRYREQRVRWRQGGAIVGPQKAPVAISRDFETKPGPWQRLDLYCVGQTAIHVVNGRPNLALFDLHGRIDGAEIAVTSGKLQLQSEYAETYYRRLVIRPMSRLPAAQARLLPQGALPNTLTRAESKAGFRLLFDGHTTRGFRGLATAAVPPGIRVADGSLALTPKAGDLMTVERFGDFELSVDWRLPVGGNSGIYYFVDPARLPLSMTTPEYELRDNNFWPEDPYKTGALYGLVVPPTSATNTPGAWNRTRIVSRAGRIEHWLNGVKVVDVQRQGTSWDALRAGSKFKSHPEFAHDGSGHILFQDHGAPLQLRSVKVKTP